MMSICCLTSASDISYIFRMRTSMSTNYTVTDYVATTTLVTATMHPLFSLTYERCLLRTASLALSKPFITHFTFMFSLYLPANIRREGAVTWRCTWHLCITHIYHYLGLHIDLDIWVFLISSVHDFNLVF